MNKIRKMLTAAGGGIKKEITDAANTAGSLFLKGLSKVGLFINGVVTSGATTDFGLTSPFVMSSMEERKAIQKGKQLAKEKINEKIAEGMTWVSPLNYGAALWNGHGLNAKEGEKEVASWSPAWLAVGRVGELYITPKIIKGTKNTPAAINSTTKAIKTKVRDHKIAKAFDELVDEGIRPDLYLKDLMYRVTTPKEVSALNSGDFVIKPSAENHGVYGWRVGAPFYKPGSHVESVMVGRRNSSGGTSTPIHNPVYLTAPVSDNLYVRLGSGGRYGRQVLSTRVHPGGKHDYQPSGGLYFPEESSIAFLVGDVIPQNITAWRRHNGVWGYEDVTPVLQYGPYRTPVYDTLPMVYRTSAKEYFNWMKGENPKVSLDDPNAAFIELRSHPEGHATVATRHLKDANGRDITFTFDEAPKDNLLQLEFDDSHGPSVLTLDADLISQNVKAGNWKGSEIAEEVKRGTPRESVTFKNITPELADLVIEFIEKNSGKNIYVHCLRGSSRSGAFDKFLEDYYGYGRPQGKNVNAASPEVYNALVKAYERKHPVLKHKQGNKLLKAQGGTKFKTTGGTGYIPNNYGQSFIDYVRNALYKNITPFGYQNPMQRVTGAISGKQDESRAGENVMIDSGDAQASALDAVWGTYLNIPITQRRKIKSKYNLSKTPEGYYRFNSPELILNFDSDLSSQGLYAQKGRKATQMNAILGNYTVGLGRDNKGDYIYYSDSKLNEDGSPNLKTGWDINPYSNTVDNSTEETTENRGQYGQDKKSTSYKIGKALFGNISDLSMGIGKPVPIYDKVYLDDYYKVPNAYKGGIYLPEVTVIGKRKKKAYGGKITINNE